MQGSEVPGVARCLIGRLSAGTGRIVALGIRILSVCSTPRISAFSRRGTVQVQDLETKDLAGDVTRICGCLLLGS